MDASKKKDNGATILNEAAAIDAFMSGDEAALSSYLYSGDISDRVRELLAVALDPGGATRQKLVFSRARAGYPASPLRTELKKAYLGHKALGLKEEFGTWPKVDDELRRLGLLGEDTTSRVRAVRFVRRAKEKPPQ